MLASQALTLSHIGYDTINEGRSNASHGVTQSHPVTKVRTLNESIAIMLRSYTRAIQKQENITGSLFQMATKAICLNNPKLEPAYFNTAFGTAINRTISELEYPQVCFNYIHKNPLHHHVVNNLCDWEFSSYPDYFCNRQGKLINRKRAEELGLLDADNA